MKFLKWLLIIIICLAVFPALSIFLFNEGTTFQIAVKIILFISVSWPVFLIVKYILKRLKSKGAVLQGIWVLEKKFRFDYVLKKYEFVPVDEKKNYFEFRNGKFRSGDLDENLMPLPAEYSPFFVDGDKIILESEFLKKADWKWSVKRGKLELTGETTVPKKSKSQFIFFRKDGALFGRISGWEQSFTIIIILFFMIASLFYFFV